LNGSYFLAIISTATTGAVLGFLYYNWQPAKIFMGDTGALSLGFLFSILTILFLNENNNLANDWHKFNAPLAAMVSILFVPLFDTCRIIVVRLVKRKSPFKPDKNHTHHVLMRLGLSHAMTAILLGVANVIVILVVATFNDLGDNILLPSIILISFILSVTVDQLIIHKVRTKRARGIK
jgi:UDP-GlcNAc:undecaprenyl-phosphate GlcNAc-1-phosphate transferase